MQGKEGRLGSTVYSKRIACRGLAIHVGLAYAELYGEEPKLCIRDCHSEEDRLVLVLGLSSLWGCDKELVGEAIASVKGYLGLNGIVEIEVDCSNECNKTMQGMLREISEEFIEHYMLDLRRNTIAHKKEYFMLVTWNGLHVIGRGEEDHIRIPLVRGPVFAHTHTSGSCIPSHKDILSMQDFLAEGGLVEAIVGLDCVLIAETLGLSEEDYWALQEIASCLQRKERDYLYTCSQKLFRLKTVNIYIRAI
ncbi:MAG: hypothetical protein ABWW69_04795 [Pyrodictiaceae archaeon]